MQKQPIKLADNSVWQTGQRIYYNRSLVGVDKQISVGSETPQCLNRYQEFMLALPPCHAYPTVRLALQAAYNGQEFAYQDEIDVIEDVIEGKLWAELSIRQQLTLKAMLNGLYYSQAAAKEQARQMMLKSDAELEALWIQ